MKFDFSEYDNTQYLAEYSVPVKKRSFDIYSLPHDDDYQKRIAKQKRILVSEGDKIDYVGKPSQMDSKYCIGVVENGVLKMHEAVVCQVRPVVKRLQTESQTIKEKTAQARNQLGEAFGTKKRKQIIKAREINQIQVKSMTNVQEAMKDIITTNTQSLPSKQELQELNVQEKWIPPCNVAAATPEQVYETEKMVPQEVLDAIDIKHLWKLRLTDEVKEKLKPLRPLNWVLDRIGETLTETRDKKRFVHLIYLAFLFRLYMCGPAELNSQNVSTKCFNGASNTVLDHLYAQFIEASTKDDGTTQYRATPQLKDKLLGYIIAFCLNLNNFILDPSQIATELKLSSTKIIKVAKELGCRTERYRPAEGGMQSTRIVLTLPLVFPTRNR
ncbi:RNA polymerase I associated factor, A49-like protein [Gorgonomyces haynaldii]|nr:RNA polymerase I associated factor, A49-like protein [Gorgonomyces haynaldii]